MPGPGGDAVRLVVVGPGRLGLSLAVDLAAAGVLEPRVVVGRRPAPPPFLRRHAPAVRYLATERDGQSGRPDGGHAVARVGVPPAAALSAALGGSLSEAALLFAVPDDAIPGTAAAWTTALARADLPVPAIALHTSGFHRSDALAPLADGGASVGSWHPLVALAAPRREAFRGSTVGVEGESAAIGLAESIARAVGARPVRLRADGKARWHAAAVYASNCLVACLSVAAREVAAASDGEAGLVDLLPLARSALQATAEHGLAGGLTGPVARGDVETVVGHLRALDPAAASLYRLLAEELLRIASPRLSLARRRALHAALAESEAPGEAGDAAEEG